MGQYYYTPDWDLTAAGLHAWPAEPILWDAFVQLKKRRMKYRNYFSKKWELRLQPCHDCWQSLLTYFVEP